MDYTLDVDVEHRFARLTWNAPISERALLALWKGLAADERGVAAFDTLIDLRAVAVRLTFEEVRRLADAARRQPPSRRAIVTGADADFGLMRMLELMSEPGARQHAVFRSIDEACAWLANPGCRPLGRQP